MCERVGGFVGSLRDRRRQTGSEREGGDAGCGNPVEQDSGHVGILSDVLRRHPAAADPTPNGAGTARRTSPEVSS